MRRKILLSLALHTLSVSLRGQSSPSPSLAARDKDADSLAMNLLKKTMASLDKQCDRVFKALRIYNDPAELIRRAEETRFIDMRTNGSRLVHDFLQNGNNTPIGELVRKDARAQTIYGPNGSKLTAVALIDFFGRPGGSPPPDESRGHTILHEVALHVIKRWPDDRPSDKGSAQARLNPYGFRARNGDSHEITEWFAAGCPEK